MGNRESMWYGELAAERFRQSGERAFQHASRMTAAGAAASAISRALDNRNYLPPLSKNIQYTPAKPQPDPRVDQLVKNMAVMAGFMLSESRHQEEDTRQVNSQLGELRGQLHDIMSRPAPEPQVHVEVVPIVIQAPPPPEPKEPPKPTINKDPDVLDQSENPHKELVLAALRSGVLVKVPQRLMLAKLISEGVPLEFPLSGEMTYKREKTFQEITREDERYYKKHGRYPDDLPSGTVDCRGDAVADGQGVGRPGKLTGALAMNDNELNLTITTPANLAGNILGVGREDKRGQMELRFFPIEESQRDLYKQTSLGRLDQIANAYLPARAWPVDGLEGQVMADLLMDSVLRDCEDPKLAGAWRKFLDQYGGKIPVSARFSIESSLSSQPTPQPINEVEAATPDPGKSRKRAKKESENIDDPHKAEIMKAVKNGTFVKIPEDVVKTMIAKAEPAHAMRIIDLKSQRGNVINITPVSSFSSHQFLAHMYMEFLTSNGNLLLEVHGPKPSEWEKPLLVGLGIEREGGSFELKLATLSDSFSDTTAGFNLENPKTITNLYAPKKAWHLSNIEGAFVEDLAVQVVNLLKLDEKARWEDYLRFCGQTMKDDFRLRIEAALF